ncbi:MAG: transposase DNA-binding-containing protein [Nostoc sp. DedQUE05]|uniref:IS4/Tn5 family transposase DNA-binding protein n=1 Tax=Nostoc sp. DedQUE05 TaxID=3075391 RepID=UPI002AD2C30A|nr:transposase DNA-binding-containing protein [Nostoc sp. DedQUE05]MDZ8091582.1 transposase DNA-binding-containing protein [Nostoc sp. DedQUE05]
MKILEKNLYKECNFGDKRLTQRAAFIGELLSVKYGQPLSKIFKTASDLKRGYEFFSNPKTNFEKLTQPYFKQTAQEINGTPVVLAVGDTTFLDYKKILDKREEYGPIGNGGNGLILHSCLALEPDLGQTLGLLWEKL